MVSVHRHVAVLSSMLDDGESDRLWIAATLAGRDQRGALMVTDRRVLFTGLAMFTQTQESFALAVLTEVRIVLRPEAPRRAAGALHLGVLGDGWTFTGRREDVERAATAIDAARTALGLTTGTAPAPAQSVLERLERLDRLQATGAITAEEFAAAKRRLLE